MCFVAQRGHILKASKIKESKTILSGHSKIDKTKILITKDSLMKVKSIAECSHWTIVQYF